MHRMLSRSHGFVSKPAPLRFRIANMNERKLVIGCGYVGRRVARRWIAQGDAVFALTRSIEHAGQLKELGIEPIVGDVTDAAALSGLPPVDTLLYAVGLDRDSGKSQRDVYVGGLANV